MEFLQASSLTTGIDEFTGNGNDETFTAGVVDAKTGAEITSINDGDEIDGGAGDDTLNITATADDNTSLTGLTVKNVEVVNITGANNLGVSSTVTDAASAGVAAEVTLSSTGALTTTGRVEIIDFGDLSTTATSSSSGTITATVGNVSGSGGTGYAVTVGAGKSGSQIAALVADRLDNQADATSASTRGLLGADGVAESVTVDGSKVIITYKDTFGTTESTVMTTSSTTLDSTKNFDAIGDVQVTTDTAATITNAVSAASDTIAVSVSSAGAGTITIGNTGNEAFAIDTTSASTVASVSAAIVAAVNGKAISEEQQTITFGSLLSGTTTNITVGGIEVTLSSTATDAADYAAAVSAAINGKQVTTSDGELVTVKANQGATTNDHIVYLEYDAADGNVGNISITAPSTTTVTSATATAVAINTATVGFIAAETERGSGIVSAETTATGSTVTGVKITYGLGFGASHATTASVQLDVDLDTSNSGVTATRTYGAGLAATVSAVSDLSVEVNGNIHALGSVTFPGQVLAGVAAGEATSLKSAADILLAAAKTKLADVLGDGFTITSDEAQQILIESGFVGQDVPTISVKSDAAAVSTASASTNKVTTGATQVAQVLTITDSVTGTGEDSVGTLYIDGVNYGDVNHLASSAGIGGLANAINAVLGAGVAVEVGANVIVTAPSAGTPLPAIAVTAGDVAQTRANVSALTTTTTVADAAVSGSQFSGAKEVWLVGSGSNATNLTVTGAQVAGLNKVTSIDGAIYTLGTASTLAISGASTNTDKVAYINGGGTTLSIIGTGTSGFSLDENSSSTATDDIDTLAVDTTGATVLTVSGLTALETISQSGAGALTLEDVGNTVSTISGGAGADKLTLNTATTEDVVSTAKDETVTGSLTGGAGNDVIIVTTSGAGIASVDAGAGNDTIQVEHSMTGEMQIAAGDGDDTVILTKTVSATSSALSQLNADVSVDGGDGIDTLVLGGDQTYLTGDYTKLEKYATGFEKITFSGATGASGTPLDLSKISGITSYTVTTGANYFEEVANGTAFTNTVMIRLATDYLGGIANLGSTAVVIETADYTADTDADDDEYDAVYGQDISITHGTLAGATTYTVSASDVTLIVGSVVVDEDTAADGNVTLAGQMETATVVLSSARGASTDAAEEYMATFGITVDGSSATDAMQGLTSIKVMGAGVVTIDASYDSSGSDSAALNLEVIDLSGMTDFADLDEDGDAEGDEYANTSTSTVTLNSEVAETLKLGGALDKVLTDSSVDYMDIIEGFSLVATADEDDDDDIVDYAQSDVLNLGGSSTDYSTADNDADGSAGSSTAFVADDKEYSSLDAALLSLAATANNEVVFHAEGNTYVFVSDANTELDAGDTVIQLTGIYDLDLLVNAII